MSSVRRKSSLIPPNQTGRRSLLAPPHPSSCSSVPPKDHTRRRIEKMEADREERRRAMQVRKKERAEEEKRNIAAGNPGDVDFIGMVRKWRTDHAPDALPLTKSNHPRICVCVRKRPINEKERARNDHDSVTCLNPAVWIHSAKLRVDGITKYLDHTSFHFDHSFDETVPTSEVYTHAAMPLLDFVCSGTKGRATVFAYGQTGSGKTYTMNGIQELLITDLFFQLEEAHQHGHGCSIDDTVVKLSFFELYGGFVQDLLNDRKRLKVLEDGKGEIIVTDLIEVDAHDPGSLLDLVDAGNKARTTHATEANDESSRSHAICQITLRDRETDELKGKLSLVDLAGSERGTDTKSHNSMRRAESADINTSLLALKECIRALDMNKKGAQHVPYRQSKLTLILKDCFTSERAMTAMIATVSPGASACDHSLNTLRYADRIKEKRAPPAPSLKRSPSRPTGMLSPKRITPTAAETIVTLRTRNAPTTTTTTGTSKRNASDHTQKKIDTRSSSSLASGNGLQSEQPEKKKANLKVFTGRDAHDSTATVDCSESEYFDAITDTHLSPYTAMLESCMDQDDDNDTVHEIHLEADYSDETNENNYHNSQQNLQDVALFEQEENILNMHMTNIHENAELLSQEGILLKTVQKQDATDQEIAEYVAFLESTLDRKEDMILQMQRSITLYQQLLEEQETCS